MKPDYNMGAKMGMRLFFIWAAPIAFVYLATAFVVLDIAWAFHPDNIDERYLLVVITVLWGLPVISWWFVNK